MTSESHRVIAIDGPAASGKSTVARQLAERLGYVYVNSGAMYRAVTWHVLEHGIDPNDNERVIALVQRAPLHCELIKNRSRIFIGEIDPGPHLRDDLVNKSVSQVSTIPQIRVIVVEKLRNYARTNDLVVEGRDIGSVVFPETPYKLYIDASPGVQSRRRGAEGMKDEIAARDRVDSGRRASPLVIAEDALVIDSSNLTIDGVVGEIIGRLKMSGMTIP